MAKDNTVWIILGILLAVMVVAKFGPGLFQKQSILYDCNVCNTNSAVIANEKVSCEQAGWTCSVSGTCLTCTQGGGDSCTDTDGGKLPNTGGKAYGVADGSSFSYYDYCVDSTTVYEYSCTGTSLNLDGLVCASGKTCVDGANGDYCKSTTCSENWQCSAWGACTAGVQYRTCDELNNCGTTVNEPDVSRTCTMTCTGTAPDCTTLDGCAGKTECMNGGWTGACVKTNPDCGTNEVTLGPTVTSVKLNVISSMTSSDMLRYGCHGSEDCISGTCKSLEWLKANNYLVVTQEEQFYNTYTAPVIHVTAGTAGFVLCNAAKTYLGFISFPDFGLCAKVAASTAEVSTGLPAYIEALKTKNSAALGICASDGGDFCSTFDFLKTALPESLKQYSCTIAIGIIALFLLVLLKGLAR